MFHIAGYILWVPGASKDCNVAATKQPVAILKVDVKCGPGFAVGRLG